MKNWSVRVGVLALLLLAGCSPVGRQFRHLVGGVQARLAEDVVIERDEWGVPHIHGRSEAAAVFGAAWAMAEDDFYGLEEGYIQALGRSAYYYGIQDLAEDIVRAAFQAELLARSEYDREPESVKRLLQAFAHGLATT
jgi:acyl-homoserine-lactone acylase